MQWFFLNQNLTSENNKIAYHCRKLKCGGAMSKTYTLNGTNIICCNILENPKCKLNISSFLTLPHLLGCLICTRNCVSIVLLLGMMEAWDRLGRGEWLINIRVWVGGQGVGIISVFVFFIFELLSFCLSCPVSFLSE